MSELRRLLRLRLRSRPVKQQLLEREGEAPMEMGRCIRSIVSPWSISSRCEAMSSVRHWRTPKVNASVMFTACFADVSMKLATLYSRHHAPTSSAVTWRRDAASRSH